MAMVEKVGDVRGRNFKLLFEQFKEARRKSFPDEPDRGMLKRFAEHIGMGAVYASNLNSGSKVIGVRTARDIEQKLNLPEGWMDTDHSRDDEMLSDDDRAFRDSVMSMYHQAPEASRAAVLRVLQALILGRPIEDIISTDKNGKKLF